MRSLLPPSAQNMIVDAATLEVRSVCGTYLGTSLPDAAGPRYCINLSCISGHPGGADKEY